MFTYFVYIRSVKSGFWKGTNIRKLEVSNQNVLKSFIARILKVCNAFDKLR